MKIGIVTLYGDNFGNKLQNLAVQRVLESLGHTAETVTVQNDRKLPKPAGPLKLLAKLTPRYLWHVRQSRRLNRYHTKNDRDTLKIARAAVQNGTYARLEKARSDAFAVFADRRLRLSPLTVTAGSGNEPELAAFDAFVCGSDQVWNPNYPSTCGAFFLTFAPPEKRIAFAPSFGVASLPEHLQPVYRRWLSEIPHLSVREEAGAALIRSLTGRDVPVLADPTLCVPRDVWEAVERKPAYPVPERYVLTYFLGNETRRYRRFIENYARQNGLAVINLLDWQEPEHYLTAPDEFLWLIRNAAAVMTDSFHGTVFSLLYHTPFLVFDRKEVGGTAMSSRLDTLLNAVHLEHRRFGQAAPDEPVDFAAVDAVIAAKQEEALAFLRRALEAAAAAEPEISSPVSWLPRAAACTGCGACANACARRCITMEADAEGFLYPHIDAAACVHCGQCQAVCPVANPTDLTGTPTAYIARTTDEAVRRASSSGGAFSVLAGAVLAQGGTVWGAAFDDEYAVCHRGVAGDLSPLRGSKYVQSRIGDAYRQVKATLESGKPVYFSGTPCQVEALLSFLGKDYDNLYTQDIICHGVPSPAVWEAYLRRHRRHGALRAVSFRDKTCGWRYFSMKIRAGHRTYVRRLDQDVYLRLFLDNSILRPSCYECAFKKPVRRSDFTLADCWNLHTLNAGADDDKGLSLLFVNTAKGRALLEQAEGLSLKEVPYADALASQAAATKSVPLRDNRTAFFCLAQEQGTDHAIAAFYGRDPVRCLHTTVVYYKTKLRQWLKR